MNGTMKGRRESFSPPPVENATQLRRESGRACSLAAGQGSLRRSIVPVFRNKFTVSWPELDASKKAPNVDYVDLGDALTAAYPTDAHFAAYSCLAHPFRLNTTAPAKVAGGIQMLIIVFDVDCESAHRSKNPVEANSWWIHERSKVLELHRQTGAFVYRTRYGYRILMALAVPAEITGKAAAKEWKRFYLLSCARLARDFGISADPRCRDWTHLYRLPSVTRPPSIAPERLETIGDAHNIGTWDYDIRAPSTADDLAEAHRLCGVHRAWYQARNDLGLPTKSSPAIAQASHVASKIGDVSAAALDRALGGISPLLPVEAGERNDLYNALAGSLCRRIALNQIPEFCLSLAEAVGDEQANDRKRCGADTVLKYRSGRPVKGHPTLKQGWPEIALAVERCLPMPVVATPPPSWLTRTPTSAQPSTMGDHYGALEQTQKELARDIDRATSHVMAGPGRIAIVTGPAGLGKTREVLVKQAESGHGGTLLALSHTALDEREEDAAGVGLAQRQRRTGLSRMEHDLPLCYFREHVEPLVVGGFPFRKRICHSCEYRENYDGSGRKCPVYQGRTGDGMTFATFAHAGAGVDLPGPVFVDELPPLVDSVTVGISEVEWLTATQAFSELDLWCEPRRASSYIVLRTAQYLRHGSLGARSKYPRRYSGEELAEAIRAVSPNPNDLQCAVEEIAVAHSSAPLPPLPHGDIGEAVRSGRVRLDRHPRADIDEILIAIVAPDLARKRTGGTACVVIPPISDSGGISIEWRRPALGRWHDSSGRPLSLVVLDATAPVLLPAIKAALPGRDLRVFETRMSDSPSVRRLFLRTKRASRTRMCRRSYGVSTDGGEALIRILRHGLIEAARAGVVTRTVGIITHQPVVRLVRDCLEAIEPATTARPTGQVERSGGAKLLKEFRYLLHSGAFEDVELLGFGAQRGSNRMNTVDLMLVVGDPWPNLDAAEEDARTLGFESQGYAQMLMDAETTQAIGRARGIRRDDTNPVVVVYAGNSFPTPWEQELGSAEDLSAGKLCSAPAFMAELVAARLFKSLGAVCSALVQACAVEPRLAVALLGSDSIPNKNVYIRDSVASLRRLLSSAASVKPREIQRAVARAVPPTAVDATTPNPLGRGGRWRWRAISPEQADCVATAVEQILTAPRRRLG